MLKRLYKNNKEFSIILIIFSIIYSIFFFVFQQIKEVWWDSSCYIGVGKWFFSGGQEGFFQSVIYPLLPFIMGSAWKIGLKGDALILFGEIIIFISCISSLILLYNLGIRLFNKKIALTSVIILGFNALYFLFTFRIYTEMITICFFLFSLFFIIKFNEKNKNYYLIFSGMFCSLAFLNKYTNIFVCVILNIILIYYSIKNKRFLPVVIFNISIFIFIIPFFLFNYLKFGDFLYLWKVYQQYANENIRPLYHWKSFPGIPRLLFKNIDWIYFKSILYLFNVTLPFFFYGVFKMFKEKRKKIFIFIFFPLIILFLITELFYLKQERYILIIFPLIALFCAYGLSFIKLRYKKVIVFLYLLFFLISSLFFFYMFSLERPYVDFFSSPPINFSCEKAISADPRIVLSDKVKKVSLPTQIFDEDFHIERLEKENPDCIFYYSCFDGRKNQILDIEKKNYSLTFNKDNGRCSFAIFKKF